VSSAHIFRTLIVSNYGACGLGKKGYLLCECRRVSNLVLPVAEASVHTMKPCRGSRGLVPQGARWR
jgi:hypothetical protein